MIQSIKISLNKTTFTLNNGAYEMLNAYMFELKNSFKNDNEIVFDIEARLAELLTIQLATTSDEVVNEVHVKNALNTIGTVNELLNSYKNENNYNEDNKSAKYNSSKQVLRRNSFNQSLGGVCSGIANYLNIDTSFIRIAFVFAFFIFGSGFLIYIILWIVIPKATGKEAEEMILRENNNPNKIYRNKSNQAIGGVCSALAIHFGLEIWVIRLAFFVGLFFYGSTFILYIIAWIIIPLIPNNLYNSRFTINKDYKIQNESQLSFIRNVFKLVIFILALSIVGVFIASVFFTAGLFKVFFDENVYDFILNTFTLETDFNLIIIGVLLCLLTPILLVLAVLSKYFFKTDINFNYAGSGLFILFFIGLGLLIYSGINEIPRFINQEENTDITNTRFVQNDSLKIFVDEIKTNKSIKYFQFNGYKIQFCDSGIFVPVEYNFLKTLEDTATISITKKIIAQKDDENVFDNVDFRYNSNSENLNFPSHYFIPKGKKFKFQSVKVKVFLKENKIIYLSETAQKISGIISRRKKPTKYWFNTNQLTRSYNNDSEENIENELEDIESKVDSTIDKIERKADEIEQKAEELENKAEELRKKAEEKSEELNRKAENL